MVWFNHTVQFITQWDRKACNGITAIIKTHHCRVTLSNTVMYEESIAFESMFNCRYKRMLMGCQSMKLMNYPSFLPSKLFIPHLESRHSKSDNFWTVKPTEKLTSWLHNAISFSGSFHSLRKIHQAMTRWSLVRWNHSSKQSD